MRKYPSRFMVYYEYFKAKRSNMGRRNLISVWALNLKSKSIPFCRVELQYPSHNPIWLAYDFIQQVSLIIKFNSAWQKT